MNEPNGPRGPLGHPCPECGAPRAADHTPSCACARRTSDAVRETRTAEVAAAEDFDPLRVRPYVEYGRLGEPGEAGAAGPGASGASGASGGVPAEPTMPLRAVPAAPAGAGAEDLELFEEGEPAGDPASEPRRRRRGTLLLVAAGAVVAVAAAAGFASGLFSYETPTRDTAAPRDVRAAVPGPSDSPSSAAASATGTASPSPSASDSPSPSASDSASPSPSASSASPSPSRSPSGPASPSATASAPTPSASGPDNGRATALRRGDKGPEVAELQTRLRQVGLYGGDIDGSYDEQVENGVRTFQWWRGIQEDEPGVYGAVTRARLEGETQAG
ncbi:peptidoglycan-binding domain-containing protein [Streptomyces longwoodensis]|uniref:peptidoglycan-binding domain-containing protein n=1 Tax=Streptomyces longwoodensis TaxID=68231 RepID=UPI000AF6034A|nr:peptidoglycan-binding domain-containing protein [Streptomyces longwoodensis]